MRTLAPLHLPLATAGLALAVLYGACAAPAKETAAAGPTPVERGRYLVESAALCGDCHTPRLQTGAPDLARALQGAPLGFAPSFPVPGWMPAAPGIAGGATGWTDAQMVAFLETGKKPDGSDPHPPMPAYRFTHEDAAAVAAYLRSLPGPGGGS